VALARKNKCVLQVGHVERFNPVMRYLNDILREARFIEVHRLSPLSGSLDRHRRRPRPDDSRSRCRAVAGESALTAVDAVGIPVLSESEDIANARLKFADGCVANITASRVSAERMRKIRIFGRTDHGAAYISLDYMKQEGELYRVAAEDAQESGLLKKLLAGKHASIVSEFAGRRSSANRCPSSATNRSNSSCSILSSRFVSTATRSSPARPPNKPSKWRWKSRPRSGKQS
jgi:hypothetical protein